MRIGFGAEEEEPLKVVKTLGHRILQWNFELFTKQSNVLKAK
jgi:hypothetical protein